MPKLDIRGGGGMSYLYFAREDVFFFSRCISNLTRLKRVGCGFHRRLFHSCGWISDLTFFLKESGVISIFSFCIFSMVDF